MTSRNADDGAERVHTGQLREAKSLIPQGRREAVARLKETLSRVIDEWQTTAALQNAPLGIPRIYATSLVNDLVHALSASGGEAEPVAWRAKLDGANEWFLFDRDITGQRGWVDVQPLYAAPNPQGDWLPIEGAPKDGTDVLAFGWWRPTWCPPEPRWAVMSRRDDSTFDRNIGGNATHWMPLPPPPVGEG